MKSSLSKMALATVLAVCAGATSAQAQATRTFISGVGNDADPCSRTQPCRTFTGALIKTFINGEINCLDAGSFGTFNITKSITLDCYEGYGSILASGTTGIVINISPGNANDPQRSVRLRNLSINGTGASGTVGTRTGIDGIRILSAARVFVENVTIANFSQKGIQDARHGGGTLLVVNSIIRENGGGIIVDGTSATAAKSATIRNSTIAGNTQDGVEAFTPPGGGTVLIMLEGITLAYNGRTGVSSTGAGANVRIGGSVVTANAVGVQIAGGGGMRSFKNNQIFNNTVDGTPIAALPLE